MGQYVCPEPRFESLEPFITRLNEIRKLHPALHQLRTITFHHVDNDALLAYSKFDPTTGDQVLVVVTLNPFGPEEATLWLDPRRMLIFDPQSGDNLTLDVER